MATNINIIMIGYMNKQNKGKKNNNKKKRNSHCIVWYYNTSLILRNTYLL